MTTATHAHGTETTLSGSVLEQRVTRLQPRERVSVGDEILFVAQGEGVLRGVGGEEHRLTAETGAFAEGEVEATTDLELVRVAVPKGEATTPRLVPYGAQQSESAGIGREFRLLAGCSQATQFVGVVPPGRAAMHSHPYDELAYIVEGDGVLHWDNGTSVPVGRGSCIHFPRLIEHSLENVGETPLRIMGVFHPPGSPAARAGEAGD